MRIPSVFPGLGKLSPDAEQTLRLLAAGGTLKAHRCLDGYKAYRMHPLQGAAVDVPGETMDQLKARRLIDSNKKFPAAVYLLTQKGRRIAAALVDTAFLPIGPQQFQPD